MGAGWIRAGPGDADARRCRNSGTIPWVTLRRAWSLRAGKISAQLHGCPDRPRDRQYSAGIGNLHGPTLVRFAAAHSTSA